MWDNFEKLNWGTTTSKTARFDLEERKHTFLEILLAYPLKSHNLFNFREGAKRGGGANRVSVTPLIRSPGNEWDVVNKASSLLKVNLRSLTLRDFIIQVKYCEIK